MQGPSAWKPSSPKLLFLCLQTLHISFTFMGTLEIGQPLLLLPHPLTWSASSTHPYPLWTTSLIFFLPVMPVSVALFQVFIRFCWDQCSSLPTGFLSFSPALYSAFSVLVGLNPLPHLSGFIGHSVP